MPAEAQEDKYMALSRKFLSALGIEADKIDEIINAHSETVDALKEERDKYKANAEGYDEKTKEVEKLQKEIETLKDSQKDSYKVKYEAIKEEFDDYKKSVESEKTKATKTEAFKGLLKEIGVAEKRIDSVTRVSDIDSIKLDKDGKIENVADLKKSLSEEWADFIVKEQKKGADTKTPPDNNGGKVKTKKEIMEITDTEERQKALREYLESQEE